MPSPSVISSSASSFHFIENHGPDVVISRKDQHQSLEAFENLLLSAKAYRNCMLALAKATSEFAGALEECARQKGANGPPSGSNASAARNRRRPPAFGANGLEEYSDSSEEAEEEAQGDSTSAGEKLMAASALHHLMGNRTFACSSAVFSG